MHSEDCNRFLVGYVISERFGCPCDNIKRGFVRNKVIVSLQETFRSKARYFCGSFLLFMFRVCHAFLSVHCSLVVTCWERTGLLALFYAMFYCVLSLSNVVAWVRWVI